MKMPRKTMWIGVGVCAVGLIVASAAVILSFVHHRSAIPARTDMPGSLPMDAASPEALRAASSAHDGSWTAGTIGTGEGASLASLKLLGTFVADDPRESLAILGDPQRKKRAFTRLGDHIGTWELITIERGWVLFNMPDGNEFKMELEQSSVAANLPEQSELKLFTGLTKLSEQFKSPSSEVLAKASQAITVVSQQERVVNREQMLNVLEGNPFSLLSQARVFPNLDGARLNGFRITWLADSPWTQKAGLKVGDVVTSVNGKPVLDPRKVGEIFTDLFSAPSVDLTIQRGGQAVTLRYQMDQMASSLNPLKGEGSP